MGRERERGAGLKRWEGKGKERWGKRRRHSGAFRSDRSDGDQARLMVSRGVGIRRGQWWPGAIWCVLHRFQRIAVSDPADLGSGRHSAPPFVPQAPPSAPFFLPTVAGVQRAFDANGAGEDPATDPAADPDLPKPKRSRMLNSRARSTRSRLVQLLYAAAETAESDALPIKPIKSTKPAKGEGRATAAELMAAAGVREQEARVEMSGEFEAVMAHLRALSPSALDLEMQTISEDDGGAELELMLHFFAAQLSTRRDFELTQARCHTP